MFKKTRLSSICYSLVLLAGSSLLLAACGDPVNVEVTRTVEVTKIVEVTRTVAVAGSPQMVTVPVTVLVDRIITATPAPTTAVPATVAPTTVAAAAMGKVGEPYNKDGHIITIHSVEKGKTYNDFITPKAGTVFITVDVTIENADDKPVSVNKFFSSVRDDAGRKYAPAFTGKEPDLGTANAMPKGDKQRGWASYEVPADAKGLIWEYAPPVVGKTVRVQIPLGQ